MLVWDFLEKIKITMYFKPQKDQALSPIGTNGLIFCVIQNELFSKQLQNSVKVFLYNFPTDEKCLTL